MKKLIIVCGLILAIPFVLLLFTSNRPPTVIAGTYQSKKLPQITISFESITFHMYSPELSETGTYRVIDDELIFMGNELQTRAVILEGYPSQFIMELNGKSYLFVRTSNWPTIND